VRWFASLLAGHDRRSRLRPGRHHPRAGRRRPAGRAALLASATARRRLECHGMGGLPRGLSLGSLPVAVAGWGRGRNPGEWPGRHAPAVTVAPLRAVDSAGPWSGPWCSLSSSLVSRKRGAQRRPSESNGDFAASGLPLPSLWPEPRAAGCSVQFTAPPLLHGSAKLHFASTCPIEAISASAAS
jgi:hypothetical protein